MITATGFAPITFSPRSGRGGRSAHSSAALGRKARRRSDIGNALVKRENAIRSARFNASTRADLCATIGEYRRQEGNRWHRRTDTRGWAARRTTRRPRSPRSTASRGSSQHAAAGFHPRCSSPKTGILVVNDAHRRQRPNRSARPAPSSRPAENTHFAPTRSTECGAR
jgi:hypothetical protein